MLTFQMGIARGTRMQASAWGRLRQSWVRRGGLLFQTNWTVTQTKTELTTQNAEE